MKIALLGDYSSLHFQLREGFRNHHGVSCDIFASGDYYKKTTFDYFYGNSKSGYLGLFNYLFIKQPRDLKKIFDSYDVVQFISPNAIILPTHGKFYYAKWLLSKIDRNKTIFSMIVAGCDSRTEVFMRDLDRSPCVGCLKDKGQSVCHYIEPNVIKYQKYLEGMLEIIFPMGSGVYTAAYPGAEPVLPFPVDSRVPYKKNTVTNKIKILHGITRPGFKGSETIVRVLQRLEKACPDDFEIIIMEKMPLQEYLEVLSGVNIVIDQWFSDALGINALLSLAYSKIVFTSYHRSWVERLYGKNIPAKNISNESGLYNELMAMKAYDSVYFETQGKDAREFIIEHCDPANISGTMLKKYKELLAKK